MFKSVLSIISVLGLFGIFKIYDDVTQKKIIYTGDDFKEAVTSATSHTEDATVKSINEPIGFRNKDEEEEFIYAGVMQYTLFFLSISKFEVSLSDS